MRMPIIVVSPGPIVGVRLPILAERQALLTAFGEVKAGADICGYAFFAPQNTGADPFTSPVTFDRHAACGRYWPNGMLGTEVKAAAWNAISCLRRSASFGASIQAS